MSSSPFFKLRKKNGVEVTMGPSFGWTVFMVILVLMIGYLAISGVNGWQALVKLAVPFK
jgi:hypothetical protein